MANFAGFTDKNVVDIAKIAGFQGSDIDMAKAFINSTPKAQGIAVKLFKEANNKYNKGGYVRGFAPGGMPLSEMNKYIKGSGGDYKDLSTFDNYNFTNAPFTKEEWKEAARSEGYGANTQASTDANIKFGATAPGATTYTPDPPELSSVNTTTADDVNTGTSTTDPNNTGTGTTGTGTTGTGGSAAYAPLITSTPISTISDAEIEKGKIASGKGQVSGEPTKPDLGSISPDTVSTDQSMSTNVIADDDIKKVADDIDTKLSGISADTGSVSDTVEAETMTRDELNQLDEKAAKIDDAQTVTAPNKRTLQDNETVQSAYDKDKVDDVIKKTEEAFVTADPSTKALVQGQLDNLMDDFEGGATPVWAAGAMRTALAALNARGLNASSLAGQAIVQAAMESAIPIAQTDAGTVAKFELENLSNRQQATILGAEQRATFLGQEFDMEFQTRVKNASTISEIAKQNYDADVQIALENARMANTVDLANLEAENAKVLSDAAALTKMDLTNLTNKQQAEVANAENTLAMDMKNLDNKQQVTVLKGEAKVQALFKDQAAENAAAQFNASEKNKVDMFMEGLVATMQRHNSEQKNVMEQVKFTETNAMNKFFSTLKENRAQFNAQNDLVIAQANAQWYQQVTTTNTAAKNAANMQDAQNATSMTKTQLDHTFQAERDMMNWIFTADDNDKTRAANLMIAQLEANAQAESDRATGWSSIFQSVLGVLTKKIVGVP
tara:strand:+ start:549 stop:2726 length:2178 start_codon:yes stop_codon:yes gene_type:complete